MQEDEWHGRWVDIPREVLAVPVLESAIVDRALLTLEPLFNVCREFEEGLRIVIMFLFRLVPELEVHD